MKKLLFAAALACLAPIAATAQGPATPPISAPATGGVVTTPAAAPTPKTTMSVDLASGTKKTVAVSQTVADSLVLAGEIDAGLEVAKAVTVLAEAKARADKATAEATARSAKALEAKADSLQRANATTLKPLSRGDCVDWAADGTSAAEDDLRLEALRVRWHIQPFPTALKSFESKATYLLARSAAGGDSSAEVAALRSEVKALKANTEAAVAATFAEARGLRDTVVKAGLVSEADVVAAVDELLRSSKFTFADATKETAPSPSDGARVVLKAGGDD